MPDKECRSIFSPGITRFSIAYCLGALALAYVSMPFVGHVRHGIFIESVLMTIVLLASVLAWGVCLAIPPLIIRWVNYVWPHPVLHKFFFAFASIFCLFVVAELFRYIFRAKRVEAEVLCAAVAAYLLLALIWSFGYNLIAEIVPGAFAFTIGPTDGRMINGFTALYFSFSTLCTVGYGDIIPISRVARMFAMTEATLGMFYIAMMISRLVSLYSAQAKNNKDGF